MAATKSFQGANVFMSRNLVPPEIFDMLHDALKQSGADVFLCCDPSRTGSNDYHIISSSEHEKFEDLRSKGCNLLGPQCVLSCAKEHRALPKQGFTCCLAMDGVKVLASGFEMEEKVKIGQLVTMMGGVLQNKASSDVNFVIMKNVLAAKYKWAANILKKPIVTINWLYQCWNEHRLVSQESYRVLPLAGLTICATRIPADERKEMEKLIIQNGGKYSAELTRKCTHLVCDAPEGDIYKVARSWGHIHITTRRWFDQSIARKACNNEESHPVQGGAVSSINKLSAPLTTQHYQERVIGSQSAASSVAVDSNLEAVSCGGIADPDLRSNLSQNISSTSEVPDFVKDESGVLSMQQKNEMNCDGCVADDSQTEDSDLYLSDCRIVLVGFEAYEMRKLVNIVRKGGGSRHMSFNEKLTHIVVGTPSEMEKKELRSLAALGIIKVVKTTWLEDCDRVKKEIPVLQRHIAHDLLLKDPVCLSKGAAAGLAGMKQGSDTTMPTSVHADPFIGSMLSVSGRLLAKSREPSLEVNMNVGNSLETRARSAVNEKHKGLQKIRDDFSNQSVEDSKVSSVFKGRLFRFSDSFAEDRRAEIVQWVNQGGGQIMDDKGEQNVHFTIESHGLVPRSADVSKSTYVSSHWIRSCLEDGCLLDVGSHILYSPLPCRVPLPHFERFWFCVSQYEEKDRVLLRNLCFVLGAKFGEKLTKKVTHLLCKFTSGPKYEAACKYGIHAVTAEWIYACVRQNEVISLAPYCPRAASSQDQEAGFCTSSQYPSQAVRMISGENPSQYLSQSQGHRNIPTQTTTISERVREEAQDSGLCSKRARILEDCSEKGHFPLIAHQNVTKYEMHAADNNRDVSHAALDVASAIEDLLDQTSKIHDLKSPEKAGCEKSLFSSDCSSLGQDHSEDHSAFGFFKQWSHRIEKRDDLCNAGDGNASIYDGFSETQTESQVVGYEEDLSGRQMIIDRVRQERL